MLVKENAKILSVLGIDYVKLDSLYVAKGTPLADMYERQEFKIIPLKEYTNRMITFLEYLHPDIVVHVWWAKDPRSTS